MFQTKEFFSLKNRTAIVTGGASGLGLAITRCMIGAGAKVIVLGRRSKEEAEKVLKEFEGNATFYQYDIMDTGNVQSFVNGLVEKHGPISILVNNAGNHCKKDIENMSVEEYTEVLNVHLVGAFAITKALFGHMKKQKRGSILFQASMTSYIGQPQVAGYSTAKAGYLGLMHTLAAEGGAYGVRVNAIAPGWIDTPMFHAAVDADERRRNKIFGRIPMNRIGDPMDIGMAAVFLSSDGAKYITGICLPVDGGALIGF